MARHAEAEALVTPAAEEVERERKATDAAQQALESVQTQVSTQGKDAPEELYAQQKEMSARARQQQEAFAEAVKRLTEAQKTESLLAVEVVRLWLCFDWELNRSCLRYAVRMGLRRELHVRVVTRVVLVHECDDNACALNPGNAQDTSGRGTARPDSRGTRAEANPGTRAGV